MRIPGFSKLNIEVGGCELDIATVCVGLRFCGSVLNHLFLNCELLDGSFPSSLTSNS